jgi:trans-aconitate methyltransferase
VLFRFGSFGLARGLFCNFVSARASPAVDLIAWATCAGARCAQLGCAVGPSGRRFSRFSNLELLL